MAFDMRGARILEKDALEAKKRECKPLLGKTPNAGLSPGHSPLISNTTHLVVWAGSRRLRKSRTPSNRPEVVVILRYSLRMIGAVRFHELRRTE